MGTRDTHGTRIYMQARHTQRKANEIEFKTRKKSRDTEYPVTGKAECRVRFPHVKEGHSSPASPWELGEAGNRTPSPSEGTHAAGVLISGVWPPDLKDSNILLLKSPSSWYFVIVALQASVLLCFRPIWPCFPKPELFNRYHMFRALR